MHYFCQFVTQDGGLFRIRCRLLACKRSTQPAASRNHHWRRICSVQWTVLPGRLLGGQLAASLWIIGIKLSFSFYLEACYARSKEYREFAEHTETNQRYDTSSRCRSGSSSSRTPRWSWTMSAASSCSRPWACRYVAARLSVFNRESLFSVFCGHVAPCNSLDHGFTMRSLCMVVKCAVLYVNTQHCLSSWLLMNVF